MRGTGALITATLLLGGCGGSAAEPAATTIGAVEPSESVAVPSVEVSVDTAAEPEEPEAPEMPALAREQTPEGAVAFAEWWYSALEYATNSGDVAALINASHADCGSCGELVRDIDDTYEQGGEITGGAVRAEAMAPGGVEDDGILLAVRVNVEPVTYLDAGGKVASELGAESLLLNVTLLKEEGRGWLFASATNSS